MNEIITNLMNQWGFEMPANIFTPMVYIISIIAFCLVFWIISKIACPNASAMRSFVMKYTCVVMAIVVFLSCLATNGITINLEKGEITATQLEYSYTNETLYQVINLEDYTDGFDIINEENIEFNGLIIVDVLLGADYELATIGALKNGNLVTVNEIEGAGVLLVSVKNGDSIQIQLVPVSVEPAIISVSYIPNTTLTATN